MLHSGLATASVLDLEAAMAATQAVAMLAAISAAMLDSVLNSEAAIADLQVGLIAAISVHSFTNKRMRQ